MLYKIENGGLKFSSFAELTSQLLNDHWKIEIINILMNGTQRFGELKKQMDNITQKVLTSKLRLMEEIGIVARKVYAEIPPKVEYNLTSLGKSLKPILDAMEEWGYKNFKLSEKIFNY